MKKLIWVTMMMLLCACAQQAFAMGEVASVTKQTQAKMGLDFTLIADRVDSEAVLVNMEVPRKGKLKDLRSISLRIGPGRPIVSATLQTTQGKNGAWVVTFQVSPAMADRSSVDLLVPTAPREYTIYSVELKGYVVSRK